MRGVAGFVALAGVVLTVRLAHGGPPAKSVTSKPLADGKGVVFTIEEPDVRHPVTRFDMIKFKPGDRVTIRGGGCANRGGHGATSYRYIHPLPERGDGAKMYAGLIGIPGITMNVKEQHPRVGFGMVRIDWMIDDPRTIPSSVPPEGVPLFLGYEDDGYDDNGYVLDDGDSDQCKGAQKVPAHVEITIEKGLPELPNEHVLPFDLETPNRDANGFLLDPIWHFQRQKIDRLMDPWRECNPATGSDLLHGNLGKLGRCSSQVQFSQHTSYGLPGASVCGDGGHYGWFPIALTGTVNWHDCSRGIGQDGDVCFDILPTRVPAHTGNPSDPRMVRPGVTAADPDGDPDSTKRWHTEINSSETTDRFEAQSDGDKFRWWSHYNEIDDNNTAGFTDLGVACGGDGACKTGVCNVETRTCVQKNDPHSLVSNEVIAIGVADLDCEHGCQQELHPIYAIAIHTRDDPDDDRWAIMVSNAGHQGSCGHASILLDRTDFKIKLWRPTRLRKGFVVTRVEKLPTTEIRASSSKAGFHGVTQDRNGAVVEFTLPLPDGSKDRDDIAEFIDGEIHLKWTAVPETALNAIVDRYDAFIPLGLAHAEGPKHRTGRKEEEGIAEWVRKASPGQKRDQLAAFFRGKRKTRVPAVELTETPSPNRSETGSNLRMRPMTEAERSAGARALCEAFDGKIPGAAADACAHPK